MEIGRRHVLALGAATTAAAGLGIAGTAVSWWDRPAAQGFQVLSEAEARFLRALVEVAFPPTELIPTGAVDMNIDHYLDDTLASMHETTRNLLRMLLHILDTWPMATRMSGFADLAVDARAAVLLEWFDHWRPEIRQAATSLVLLTGMAYTTHPSAVGYFAAMHGCGYGR